MRVLITLGLFLEGLFIVILAGPALVLAPFVGLLMRWLASFQRRFNRTFGGAE